MGIIREAKPCNGAAVESFRKPPEVLEACAAASIIRSSGEDFAGEQEASMNDPDILKMNDELARKFRKIEADLVACREIGELFERLLSGSGEAFGIPFVWLSILRDPKTETLLRILNDSELLRNRLNVIEPSSFLEVCPDGPSSVIASGDLRPFFRLMPPNVKYFIRSLAVAPLALHGHLIGSLNHGDASPERYRPGMGTTLLDHLAATVSGRLSDLLPPGENGAAGPEGKREA